MTARSILIPSVLGLAIAGATMAAEPSQAALAAQAKITRAAAEKIALGKVPSGRIKSAELENERGALVWSFDIASPGTRNIHEILVNAKTGKIVHTGIETPKAQANEAAAEKAEAKKH
jgi:uncharacterized membrane protein YkoI